MLGALYAVLSAAAFGLNNASQRRAALSGTAFQGIAVTIPLGMALFIPATWIAGEMGSWDSFTWLQALYLAGGGFFHFIWGRYFNIKSLAAVGANIAGPVQQAQHPIAMTLAIIFLGETLTPIKISGILIIVSGPLVMLHGRAKAKPASAATVKGGTKPVFEPRMAEGYLHAFLAALGFGAAPVLVAAGLAGNGHSMMGGLISFIAATAIILVMLAVPRNWRDFRQLNSTALPWFTISGLANFASQCFRYLALALAPVTVVTPIQSLSLIFRAIFGYYLNRDYERLDAVVYVALGLSFCGAVILAAGDEVTRRYLDLPPWLAEIAAWTWP